MIGKSPASISAVAAAGKALPSPSDVDNVLDAVFAQDQNHEK